MSLQGKHILLGITGSIAAYKAAMLVRLLVKDGAEVRIVMSHSAKEFITPLTLATLCKNPILVDNFDPTNGAWNSHISIGEWADHYLIAPATANTLAKMAHGVADNLLLCTYLSARCAVTIAPAMDLDMYQHQATQDNIRTLTQSYRVGIIEPEDGELASGLIGKGRMAEPEKIVQYLSKYFTESATKASVLKGKKILVTAGATVEPIDPVRFISNYSTGKMGYAIADVLSGHGAEVTLVSGAATATISKESQKNITIIRTLSADQMYKVCEKEFSLMDGAIFCAAVADYTPSSISKEKIKHDSLSDQTAFTISLKPTVDIAAEMGKLKRTDGVNRQITIGFALESVAADGLGAEYARKKLETKNLDAIILNSLHDAGAGFGTDTNKVTIIDRDLNTPHIALPLKSKIDVAVDIADYLCNKFANI